MAVPSLNFFGGSEGERSPLENPSEHDLDALLAPFPKAWQDRLRTSKVSDLDGILADLERELSQRKLELFRPMPHQRAFQECTARIRLLKAGNRTGKSESSATEISYHLTGRYPIDWKGHRFSKPIDAWAAGVTAAETRKSIQEKLVGKPSIRAEWGTGYLPKSDIDFDHITMQPGIPDAIDTINCRHHRPDGTFDGWSTLTFKAHSQGAEKFQAAAIDLAWLDEEPPLEVYSECLTRLASTGGIMLLTFTPQPIESELVRMFASEAPPGPTFKASLHDVRKSKGGYIDDNVIGDLIAGWPEHERARRIYGINSMGAGLVWPINLSDITVPFFSVPDSFRQIAGMDLGVDHPAAFIRIAWNDPARGGDDVIYVIAEHSMTDATPMLHAAAVKSWGTWLPWSWPHDGNRRSVSGTGDELETFRDMYERHGLNMLPEHATNPKGGNRIEHSVADIRERMQQGKFKVMDTCTGLLRELSQFSRDRNGEIIKKNDDRISAMRYAVMMLRHSVLPGSDGHSSNWSQPMRRNIKRLA